MLWDTRTGRMLQTMSQHTGPLYTLAASGDGQTLATGAQDNTIRIWDLPLRSPVRRLSEPSVALHTAVLSPDGLVVLAGLQDNSLQVIPTGMAVGLQRTARAGHTAPVLSVAVRPDGSVQASADASGRLLVWSPDLDQPISRLLGSAGPVSQLLLPTGAAPLLSLGDDGVLRHWQLPAIAPRQLSVLNAAGVMLTVVPGQTQALALAAGQPLRLVNLQTGEQLREFSAMGNDVTRVAISSNAAWLVAGAANGEVRLANTGDAAVTGRVAGHDGAVTDVSVHADVQRFASAGLDGTVRLWRLPTAAKPVSGHAGPVRGVQSAASGQWGLTWSDDKAVRVWAAGGGAQQQFTQHAQPVRVAALRADDALVASGDAEGVVWVWNPTNAAVEGVVAAHGGAVQGLAFSADGSLLVTAGADGLVRCWKLPLPKQKPAAGEAAPAPAWEFRAPDNEAIVQLKRISAEQGLVLLPASGTRLHRLQWDGALAGSIGSPGGALRSVEVATSGKVLLATADNGLIHQFNADLSVLRSLPVVPGLTSAKWDREGRLLLVCQNQPWVQVRSAETGRVQEQIPALVAVHSADWLAADQTQVLGATGANDGQLLHRSLLRIWELPAGAVTLAMSPDQQHLYAGGVDGQVRQWNLSNGEPVRVLSAGQPVTELTVSGNGQVLAAGCADGLVRLWKSDGSALPSCQPATGVRSVTLNADGTRVAAGGADGLVRVWDTAAGLLLESFAEHVAAQGVAAVRFLADNVSLISAGGDGTLRQQKLAAVRAVALQSGKIRGLAALNNAASLLVVRENGQLVQLNAATAAEERVFAAVEAPFTAVSVRVDQQRTATGTEQGQVHLWNPNDGTKPLQSLVVEGAVSQLHWSADNRRLAIAAGNTVTICGPTPAGVQPPLELTVWQRIECEAPVQRLAFSADGRRLLTAVANGRVDEWACAGPEPRRQFQHGGAVYGLAVNASGSLVVSCSADQTVRVWDNVTGQQRFSLTGHQGAVHAVALSADEAFAVSSGADGTLRLWDVPGGRQLKQVISYEQTMYSVALHPSGGLLAAAGADRQVHLVDVASGSEIRTLSGHTDFIHSVAFSPDGNRVLSFGYAGQLKIWNTGDGGLLHERKVGQIGNTARYSPDGRQIVIASGDGTAQVLNAP
jgi:WD40 repeat protein